MCETKQDKALISLAYGCGLRRSELRKLDTSDVTFSKALSLCGTAKTTKAGLFLCQTAY